MSMIGGFTQVTPQELEDLKSDPSGIKDLVFFDENHQLEFIQKLGWRRKQKVVVTQQGRGLKIKDWKN